MLAASHAEAPELRHVAIGFSLSGNALLLGSARQLWPWLAGAIAVNPPVDIARASRDIQRGLCRLYELRFIHRLRRAVAEREADGLARARYRVPRLATLCEFDDLYTAPEGGFASGADYYARCSSLAHLAAITTPTAIVTAANDPFVHAGVYADAALSPAITLQIEPTGGHVAYLERRGAGWGHWLDAALLHYVEALARA